PRCLTLGPVTVVLRAFRAGRIAAVETGRVVSDDERGLLVWVAGGSAVLRRTTLDGRSVRKMPLAQRLATPTKLSPATWTGPGVLILTLPEVAHAVWWFFTGSGRFARWYVNLQEPAARWNDGDLAGADTEDHALDVWVEPDRSWRWKDED